jgi:hypothetical protein
VSLTTFQRDVARIVLDAIADLGFALGGGQALHVHGFGDRPSTGLDFYQTQFDVDLFDRAELAVVTALAAQGLSGTVGHRDSWLRQIVAVDPATREHVAIDLGQDYRHLPSVVIAGLGPVIAAADAAASEARALNDRRAARDYLDVHVLLTSGGWTPAGLFNAVHNQLRPWLTLEEFAADLAAAGDQDPDDYAAYGLDSDAIAALSAAFVSWAAQLRTASPDDRAS